MPTALRDTDLSNLLDTIKSTYEPEDDWMSIKELTYTGRLTAAHAARAARGPAPPEGAPVVDGGGETAARRLLPLQVQARGQARTEAEEVAPGVGATTVREAERREVVAEEAPLHHKATGVEAMPSESGTPHTNSVESWLILDSKYAHILV